MVRRVSSLAELKNLFYSRLLFSFPLSVFPTPSLPHSLLFLPLFLQRMLKGNESTIHCLTFATMQALACPLGQLPARDM